MRKAVETRVNFLYQDLSPGHFHASNKVVLCTLGGPAESVWCWEKAVSSHLITSPRFGEDSASGRTTAGHAYLLGGPLSFTEYHLNTFPLFFSLSFQLLVLQAPAPGGHVLRRFLHSRPGDLPEWYKCVSVHFVFAHFVKLSKAQSRVPLICWITDFLVA